MRIVLAPVGTRGDVQPLVALGLLLRNRGHDVVCSAPENFESFIQSHGLPFAPNAPGYTQFFQEIQKAPFLDVWASQFPSQFRLLDEISKGADAIVGSMLQAAGPSIAEKHGAAYCFMMPGPIFIRSREYPPVPLRQQDLPPWRNDLAWRERGHEWNQVLLEPLNRERAALDLAPVADSQDHILHSGRVLMAYDAVLAPPPVFHYPRVTTTGSWHLDEGQLDDDLRQFCETSPRPVFVGFGSMANADPQGLLRTIVEGVKRSGQRAVIGAGWSAMSSGSLPESCRLIQSAPFHLLFPQVAAAVHHGGAGTTAAAARAGIPQAIVPHFSDQYFWGERIRRGGLGPAPVPIEELTAERLAAMIDTMISTPSMGEAARAAAAQIDPDRNLTVAAECVEAEIAMR
jgi:UDP:flavonoid glycosyltransferase YjiC (YdhE family)